MTYTDIIAELADLVKTNRRSLGQITADIQKAAETTDTIAADGSLTTIATILKNLPEGTITTPGEIVKGIKIVNEEARVSAQGIARRITANAMISLDDAARCVSGLKADWNDISVADHMLHSLEQDKDVALSEALEHAGVHVDNQNGVLHFSASQMVGREQIAQILCDHMA